MGIPSVSEFNIPNLCGASAALNDMAKKKNELMKELEAGLELDASVLKEKMDVGLKDLQQKIKKLAPEMPTSVDLNLQSSLKSLSGISQSSAAGKILHDLKKADLTSKFGKALEAAGTSLDTALKSIQSNIAGGGTGCNCGVPNMMIGADGAVKEKPENPVTPVKESLVEVESSLSVPSKSLNEAFASAANMLKTAGPIVLSNMSKIVQHLGGNDGVVNAKTLDLAREADAKIKAAIGVTHPQLKKKEKIAGENKAFNNVDADKAIANPEKSDANTKPSGVGDQKVKLTNGEMLIADLEKSFMSADTSVSIMKKKLLDASQGMSKEYPENISEEKDGVTYVWFQPTDAYQEKLRGQIKHTNKWQKHRRKAIKDLFWVWKPTEVKGVLRHMKSEVEKTTAEFAKVTKAGNDAYDEIKKHWSKPVPGVGEPRGPKA